MIDRPALGQVAELGSFYDFRTDNFIAGSSLLKCAAKDLPEGAVNVTDNHQSNIQFKKSQTYREKLDFMEINSELSASFLAGLVTVGGSGKYLHDTRDSKDTMESSVIYKVTTAQETILNFGGIRKYLALDAIRHYPDLRNADTPCPTHVVTEIGWGANTIVTFRATVSETSDTTKVHGWFKVAFETLKTVKASGKSKADISDTDKAAIDMLEFSVFGDVMAGDGTVPMDCASAIQLMENMPQYIKSSNGGKGQRLTYKLLPITMLGFIFGVQITATIQPSQIGSGSLDRFVGLFDEIRDVDRALNDYHSLISKNISYVSLEHLQQVESNRNQLRAQEASLKFENEPDEVERLYKEFHEGVEAIQNLTSVTYECVDKIDFITTLVKKGARYINYKGAVETELAKGESEDAYVLYFSESSRKNYAEWGELYALLLELLDDKTSSSLVLLADEEGSRTPIPKPLLSQYRNLVKIVPDVFEEQRFLKEKCLIQYEQTQLETYHEARPVACREVLLPCPGPHCERKRVMAWVCRTYAYIYCDCGRTLYSAYGFRCNSPKHGTTFEKYKEPYLKALLDNLQPFPELNILILGETGVGKSTFINAFLNYVLHGSLEDALDAEKLDSWIPSSFSVHVQNKEDPNGQHIERKIKIGCSDDELDGSTGQSATQSTKVYRTQLGRTKVRLIDTPGIADTRGHEQDKKNMANILDSLRYFEKIHGILILLRSNNTRLSVVFRFCIKELLTHIHRDAARNIVFGFTGTSATNYLPGESLTLLREMVRGYKEVPIGLNQNQVYCFDSESFRYLAAHKQGVDMGERSASAASESWKHSAAEVEKLVNHFCQLTPHEASNTICLNNARIRIEKLTKPMADVWESIQTSIKVNKDMNRKISENKLSEEELRRVLWVKKAVTSVRPLDRPRTVCANDDCVKYRNVTHGGVNEFSTIYNTICHERCGVKGVQLETRGHQRILKCSAFSNHGLPCNTCTHNWQEHLHLKYETIEEIINVENPDIAKSIQEKSSLREQAEATLTARNTMIVEFEQEYQQLQDAAVDFSVFLKNNSIQPYNDAMIEYTDHLIRQEKQKLNLLTQENTTVKNRRAYIADTLPIKERLCRLEESQAKYKELIKAFETNLGRNKNNGVLTAAEIEARLQELFALKHYGKVLRGAFEVVNMTEASDYQENYYPVKLNKRKTYSVYIVDLVPRYDYDMRVRTTVFVL
ncbi:hypothetical protein F4810DRAFT_726394 [Camillea tinctor]|nr:hypothetical protein F4810DRAFT_726394 [Camillea tinctor]